MGVIEEFVDEYERQFDFWEASARTVRGILEADLASSGLRAIVTSRAKSVDRLSTKLRQRHQTKRYTTTSSIRDDIIDLAGVRVALYFPGQMNEAEEIIRAALDVHETRIFPSSTKSQNWVEPVGELADNPPVGNSSAAPVPRSLRFSGYGARHYRARIPKGRLNADNERYATALIEVQVASVLMHAWSEVEHDLVYKPQDGELSPSEYALLDQINGLVLAGEIGLEQLQKAGDTRVAAAQTPFRDHYELAEFLRTRLVKKTSNITDASLGRVDVLFSFLADQQSSTASTIEPFLDLLEQDFERRPVADQLADLLLAGNKERYESYSRAMATSRNPLALGRPTVAATEPDSPEKLALGEFVAAWVLLETVLKNINQSEHGNTPPLSVLIRRFRARGLINEAQYQELDLMRQLRNRVFHGGAGNILPEMLVEAAAWLRELAQSIPPNSQD